MCTVLSFIKFETRGWSAPAAMRNTATTTGLMLSSKFEPEATAKPKPEPPPPAYNELAEVRFADHNSFINFNK